MNARAASAAALLLLAPAGLLADVHRDCFSGEWSLSCKKDRIADARVVDELLAPIAAREGWSRGCTEVEYVKGDEGGPDAILVILNGPKSGTVSACRNPTYEPDEKKAAARAAGSAVLKKVGTELKKAILSADPLVRARLLKNTDVIELGDGWAGEATIKL